MKVQSKQDFETDDHSKLMEVADEVGELCASVDELQGITFELSAIEVVLSFILLEMILRQNGKADSNRAARLVGATKSKIKAMVGPNADLDFGFAVHYADRLMGHMKAKLERT